MQDAHPAFGRLINRMGPVSGDGREAEDPTVYVNSRFRVQVLTGVQRYAVEVADRLNGRLIEIAPKGSIGRDLGHLWEQVYLPLVVPKHSVLWCPTGVGPLIHRRQVLTIHDVAVLEHPEWYSRTYAAWYRWLWPKLGRRAARVITSSQYSADRIRLVLGVPASHIVVVPGGVDFARFATGRRSLATVREKYSLPTEYMLVLSAFSPRKNLERLFQAWRVVESRTGQLRLVVAGHPALRFAGGRGFRHSPRGVQFLGYVSDEDIAGLYAGAVGFVYPSLYEGFGLPLLEAMAAGTPVITSNVTAPPEVVGDAGLLVDPLDPAEIAAAMLRLAFDRALQRELASRGRERAQQFRWEDATADIWDVLQGLA